MCELQRLQVRVDKGPSHRSYTPYELSSELFNYPRMAFVSTADPSRDLRPATQTFLSFDSAANVARGCGKFQKFPLRQALDASISGNLQETLRTLVNSLGT